MTEVVFHFNVVDKLTYACRFARKAVRSEVRLLVMGANDPLLQFDRMLWAMAATDFVAHCWDDAPAGQQAASPVLLVRDAGKLHVGQRSDFSVLLNLGDKVPAGYESFAKVIEIVSQSDTADRSHARARARHYKAQGHAPVYHDLNSPEEKK